MGPPKNGVHALARAEKPESIGSPFDDSFNSEGEIWHPEGSVRLTITQTLDRTGICHMVHVMNCVIPAEYKIVFPNPWKFAVVKCDFFRIFAVFGKKLKLFFCWVTTIFLLDKNFDFWQKFHFFDQIFDFLILSGEQNFDFYQTYIFDQYFDF